MNFDPLFISIQVCVAAGIGIHQIDMSVGSQFKPGLNAANISMLKHQITVGLTPNQFNIQSIGFPLSLSQRQKAAGIGPGQAFHEFDSAFVFKVVTDGDRVNLFLLAIKAGDILRQCPWGQSAVKIRVR